MDPSRRLNDKEREMLLGRENDRNQFQNIPIVAELDRQIVGRAVIPPDDEGNPRAHVGPREEFTVIPRRTDY
jgi:hypothetical protein